jgi:hypothetical protein
MSTYSEYVEGKSAEDILANSMTAADVVGYLQLSAHVRSNHELIAALKEASDSSGKMGHRVVLLTVVLVCVGLLQALATAWPYVSWWLKHL